MWKPIRGLHHILKSISDFLGKQLQRRTPKTHRFLTVAVPHTTSTYVWNVTTFKAILFLSPAILTSIGSTAMSLSIDDKVAELNKDREVITSSSGKLENFTREFDVLRLQRGANQIILASTNGEEKLKFLLDKFYRQNTQASMRRIVSVTHPSDWQARMAAYEEITGTDYDDVATVQKLQAMENEISIEAGKRLTALQAANNKISEDIDKLTNWKTLIANIGNYIMYGLTIFLFFLRTNS